ncbi:hypothetical protein GGI20_002667 [Coemansia sp. BCRC 34301]|nr:hypothetical protein GGI20_002667 [Coemansia sp. BCRC 34301]
MASIVESEEVRQFLEVREFVIKHALEETAVVSGTAPTSPTSPTSTSQSRATPAIPTTSLRELANSLLEGSLYEEGVRFLTTVGYSSLIQDAKIVANLLAIFKPTHLIEKDLERRSQYLLQGMGVANVDYSKVWKVDSQRRRAICQSQQRVLAYLASVNVQFVKPWFDEIYAKEPGSFWDYLDELTAQPLKTSGLSVDERELELELYQNRMSLACILLEQMCADFASNMADPRRSIFLRIVYQGTAIARLAYPDKLKATICRHFERISYRWCPLEESRLLELILDMTALAGTCDHLDRGNCAQLLARYMHEDGDAELFVEFVDQLSSDLMAMEMIDYAFVSWFRFAALPGGKWTVVEKNLVGMPPSAAKTAFCLRHVRPQSKKDDPEDWHEVVCLLAKLVQRSVSAYGRRVCRVNCISRLNAANIGLDGDYPHTLLLASSRSDVTDMANSYQLLKAHLQAKMPRPTAEEVLNDANATMDCCSSDSGNSSSGSGCNPSRVALLNTLYIDLDQIETLLSCAA